MAHRANLWIGFTIGMLAALLAAALAVLFVPQLRQLVTAERAATSNTLDQDDETSANSSDVPDEPAAVQTESDNIKVTAPAAYGIIGSQVTISGQARVFENTVNVRIKDSDGRVLAETTTTAASPDVGQFGPFSVSVSFGQPTGTTGTVEVYTLSAKDGSEIDKLTIPVRFGS